MLIPIKWNTSANLKPVCIHLAGTGDHVKLKIKRAVLFVCFKLFFLKVLLAPSNASS